MPSHAEPKKRPPAGLAGGSACRLCRQATCGGGAGGLVLPSTGQMVLEEGGGIGDGESRHLEDSGHGEEAVDGAGVSPRGDAQLARVGFALVAQRVVLRGEDQGGRGAIEGAGEERRSQGVTRIGARGQILAPTAPHVGGAGTIAFGKRGVGGQAASSIDHGVDEQLAAQGRRAMRQGGTGGEVGAGAIARDGDGDPQAQRPLQGQRGIVGGGGKAVLRGETVVHREDAAAGCKGQQTADGVVAIQIAAKEPSAVKIDHQGQGRAIGGPVLAGGQGGGPDQGFGKGGGGGGAGG